VTAVSYKAPEQVVGLIPCGYGHGNPCRCAELYRLRFQNDDVPKDSDMKQGDEQQHGDFLHVFGYYAVRIGLIVILVTILCLALTGGLR
jgi:hypothetical protein